MYIFSRRKSFQLVQLFSWTLNSKKALKDKHITDLFELLYNSCIVDVSPK